MLALMLTVFPSELYMDVYAGENIGIPLTIIGKGDYKVSSSGDVIADGKITVNNKLVTTIKARVLPFANNGSRTSYIYITPDTKKTIVQAQAIALKLNISNEDNSRIIRSAKHTNKTGIMIIIAVVILIAGFYLKKRL